MINIGKLNIFLSTLFFVLCIVGYQFVTTIFLPVNSDIDDISKSVTVPYRAFMLIVMLLIFFINYKKNNNSSSLPLKILIFSSSYFSIIFKSSMCKQLIWFKDIGLYNIYSNKFKSVNFMNSGKTSLSIW